MSGKCIRRLIDIGANLTDPMFRGIYHSTRKHPDDFNSMLTRAREAGVEKMIITGGSLADSTEALSIAQTDSHLFSTVGCHPTRCSEFETFEGGPDAYLDQLRQTIAKDRTKVVAIGEVGLDYDRLHFCPKETQQLYFERQLSLAEETRLPLFLHNRNSIDDFIAIMSRNAQKFSSRGGVVHSFDGTSGDMQRILELGLYIGINGCSLKTEQNLEVAKMIPSNKLMIETDCPWCEIKRSHASFKHVKTMPLKCKDAKDDKLPVKNRNEPSSLVQVLEVLSSIRDEDIEQLAEQISHTIFCRMCLMCAPEDLLMPRLTPLTSFEQLLRPKDKFIEDLDEYDGRLMSCALDVINIFDSAYVKETKCPKRVRDSLLREA